VHVPGWPRKLEVTGDGDGEGTVSRAEPAPLRQLADTTGLAPPAPPRYGWTDSARQGQRPLRKTAARTIVDTRWPPDVLQGRHGRPDDHPGKRRNVRPCR